jgi:hypothetical protein
MEGLNLIHFEKPTAIIMIKLSKNPNPMKGRE